MENAIRIRKILGGGMRQVGFLAAAGLYALEHNIERLAEDHKKAKYLIELLKQSDCVKNVEPVETNIVIFELFKDKSEKLLKLLSEHKILITNMGNNKLRMVTHLHITDQQIDKVEKVIKSI